MTGNGTFTTSEYCAVLLAGGKSTRMGKNKSHLTLSGKTFLEIQLEKLCETDAKEILISSDENIPLPSFDPALYDKRIRIVYDIIKNKGPLGGLYSCFSSSDAPSAIVIATDTPLLKPDTLRSIINSHISQKKDATVVTVASHIEPLVAAYSTGTYPVIKELLDGGSPSIRSFLDRIDTCYLPFEGDISELYNCNTVDEYLSLTSPGRI